MMPIVDMHSHILPGIDDGARRMWETRELMKEAYEQGIRRIVATPHYHRGKHYVSPERIRELVLAANEEAGKIAPDLKIEEGQELVYFDGILEELASGRALTLAGTSYILVEFPVEVAYEKMYQAVRSLIQARYRPVLAHIERYRCLRSGGRLEELGKAGVLMQMNFTSLSGSPFHFGEWNWCRKQVMAGHIHVFGTDMHRVDYRPPKIGPSLAWLKKALPQDMERLLNRNPTGILNGNVIAG